MSKIIGRKVQKLSNTYEFAIAAISLLGIAQGFSVGALLSSEHLKR